MKTYTVEARLRKDDGKKITIKVKADSAEEARSEAAYKLIEAGCPYRYEDNSVKIVSVD